MKKILSRIIQSKYILIAFLFLSKVAFSQSALPSDGTGLGIGFEVWATRNHEPKVYTAYFSDACNDDFLLLAYTGTDVVLMAGSPGSLAGSSTYSIKLYENGVENTSAFKSSVLSGDEITYNFSSPGLKEFEYTDLYTGKVYGKIRAIINKKITKLWVEAEEICSSTYPSGQDYKFKIRTEPESLVDIFNNRTLIERTWDNVANDCENQCAYVASININLSAGASIFPIHYKGASIFSTCSIPPSAAWPSAAPVGGGEEYSIAYSDLAPWISGTSVCYPINGNISLFDGISTYSLNVQIPIKSASTYSNLNSYSAFSIYSYFKNKYNMDALLNINSSVDDHETWTPTNNPLVAGGYGENFSTIRIHDSLIIGKGQSLKIQNMTIEMGKGAQIVVQSDPLGIQEAGYLELDNSTIKAFKDCGNEDNLWSGIVLQGNTNLPQTPIGGVFNKRYQGMLYMFNNATIADAEVAVKTYDPANPITKTGGIIYANSANFNNNLVSVDFAAYPRTVAMGLGVTKNYLSNFSSCSFKVDDYNLSSTFEGFIRGTNVQGLQVNSCSFNANFGSMMVGYGIKGINMGISVKGSLSGSTTCSFKGLNTGVSIGKSGFFATGSLNVSRTNFAQNYTGVYSKGILNPTVYYNTADVPARPFPSFYGRNCSGINIETGSGYTVTNNIFSNSLNSPSGNNAVLIWNCGSADNIVQHNIVNQLEQGMISNYKNTNSLSSTSIATGLQFKCNNLDNNVGTCIAALGADNTQDGICASQGSNAFAAGNTFAHSTYDIFNPTTQVNPINYFYVNMPIYNPTISFGSVITSTTTNDGCTVLPPIVTRTGTSIPLSTFGLSGSILRETLLYNIAYYTDAYDLSDRSMQLHTQLSAMEDAYSDLARVDLFMEDGNSIEANTLYNNIVVNRGLVGTEAYEFNHWGRMLLDISIAQQLANQTPTDLSTAQLNTLNLVADSASMWAKVRAQNWLSEYDGRLYVNTYLYPNTGRNLRKSKEAVISDNTIKNRVYPNPANDYIDIVYTALNEGTTEVHFQLLDALGHIVLSQDLANKGTQRLSIEKLATGVYYYQISEQKNVTLTGKLIKK